MQYSSVLGQCQPSIVVSLSQAIREEELDKSTATALQFSTRPLELVQHRYIFEFQNKQYFTSNCNNSYKSVNFQSLFMINHKDHWIKRNLTEHVFHRNVPDCLLETTPSHLLQCSSPGPVCFARAPRAPSQSTRLSTEFRKQQSQSQSFPVCLDQTVVQAPQSLSSWSRRPPKLISSTVFTCVSKTDSLTLSSPWYQG